MWKIPNKNKANRRAPIWVGNTHKTTIYRHIEYENTIFGQEEPEKIQGNVTLEWIDGIYTPVNAWNCDGSCSLKQWDYSITTRDKEFIEGQLNNEH